MIFVNFPTTDLERAKAFYTGLGATINPTFTDENAACVVWDESTYFMILKREFFGTFTSKEVADPHTTAQAIVTFSRDSKEHVDAAIAAGVSAGGTEAREPQDFGFMYGRALEDPDGNMIEFMWMDPQAAEKGVDAMMADQDGQPAAE